jgi:hypothetical protein
LALKTETFLGPEMAMSETHVYKITNVPVFFIWLLDLMILMRANPLLRPLEGVDPDILTFLDPNGIRFDPCQFARIKIIMSHAI